MRQLAWAFAYVLGVVAINVSFTLVGPSVWNNAGAGAIFILRDAAQRALGHRVLWAMVLSIAASYLLADPRVALASGAAFAISEAIDWLVYTFTRSSWRDRMLLSSLIAAPVDSVAFLWLAGFWSVPAVLTMTAAKLLVAIVLWLALVPRARVA